MSGTRFHMGPNWLPFFILLGLLLLWPGAAMAQRGERILNYDSRIEVYQNGQLMVTEKIKVMSTGDKIKRGIYRDFPTTYKARGGKRMRVAFEGFPHHV